MKRLATKAVSTLVPLFASLVVLAATATLSHAQGNASAGEGKVAMCAACHGPAGDSAIATNPKLGGQGARYLNKQLQDIKSGARVVPEMMGLLDGLSDQDLLDISAYYAEQEATFEAADAELVELGESIYRSGIAELNVAACAACHAPSGKGIPQAGFPALAGQHSAYTAKQLRDFRAAARTNDGTGSPMQIVSERLTDREIEAIASYISGLN